MTKPMLWKILVISIIALLAGCGRAASNPSAAVPQVRGPILEYSIPAVSGNAVDSNVHRGRVTVLLFITTFDVFSQAEAARLEDLYRSHQPRINAAAVIMEPPKNLELARAFVDVLKLSYDVGMADRGELSRQGILGNIQTVPAWLFLDDRGRLTATGLGSLTITELEKAVTAAER